MGQEKGKGKVMAGEKTQRRSLSVRLQPYEGSLLAEVVRYLNGLDRTDAQRQIENVLVMALLAQARLYDEDCSTEERRRCCIEACDALDKHASMLRQLVGVPAPGRAMVPYGPGVGEPGMTGAVGNDEAAQRVEEGKEDEDREDEREENETTRPPKSRILSRAAAAEANALFGD